MNLQHYPYFNSSDYYDYEFFSDGPNGRINKVVTFSPIPDTDPIIYNLAFGDLDEVTGALNDTTISNNHDRDIVLATVANIILDFYKHHGGHYIYARGSTSSRTRLYQMSITSQWEEISKEFELYGLVHDAWQEFEPNSCNYNAFLVRHR